MRRYVFPIFLALLTGCGGGSMQQAFQPTPPKSVAGLTVTSPADDSTVTDPKVHYVASATTNCAEGIGSMGVFTAPDTLAYTVSSDQLDTMISLKNGTNDTAVQAWDKCGGTTSVPITVMVSSVAAGPDTQAPANNDPPKKDPPPGKTFAGLHKQKGWQSFALLPPKYLICPHCKADGPEMTWSMKQNVKSPSVSGNATEFKIGGETAFGDVLWNNHLVGDFSSQGIKDSDQSLVSSLHNFTYDVYFYIEDASISQAVEFDINQFVKGQSFIWGHECRIAGGHEWDVWDNEGHKWHPTGISCKPKSGEWNHLVIQVQRTDDDRLFFKSITLNGKTSNVNYYGKPTPTDWSGLTINYQQDLNVNKDPYSVWLDKLNFVYW